jgi:DNA-binding transcriptional LysR family regulator
MLDVRRLRLLRELAARGTLTAVADALAYTPSAVSQQLAALERDAGVALLERVGRGVRLTDAGRRLVDHADAVIARLEEAEADLAAAAEAGGRVQLAAFQTAVSGLVLPAMARLPAGVQVLLLEGNAEIVLPTLRLGDLDMVVAEE